MSLEVIMNYLELSKKNLVELKEFKDGMHLRFIGGITVDHWPKSKKTWIVGTDKSWVVKDIQEVFDVANLKIFPAGVQWSKKKDKIKEAVRHEYININFLCPMCQKHRYITSSTYNRELM